MDERGHTLMEAMIVVIITEMISSADGLGYLAMYSLASFKTDRMLAVVVADVAVETEYVFERRLIGTTPDQLRTLAAWFIECEVEEVVMESTAQYWRPVWEALEQLAPPAPCARPRAAARRYAPSRPSAIESWLRRTQEGLSRCGAVGETPGRAGAHLELRARRRTAPLADRNAPQVPDHAQPRSTPQPAGIAPRGSPHQGLQRGVRSAGHQRTSHAARLS